MSTSSGSSPLPEAEADSAPSRVRKWSVLVFSLGVFFVLLTVSMAIVTPKFGAARSRANVRACYANQKTLAGALEMYRIDFKVSFTSLKEAAPILKEKGYLQTIPKDPGNGSQDTYRILRTSAGCESHSQAPDFSCSLCHQREFTHVGCLRHGTLAKGVCFEHSPAWPKKP